MVYIYSDTISDESEFLIFALTGGIAILYIVFNYKLVLANVYPQHSKRHSHKSLLLAYYNYHRCWQLQQSLFLMKIKHQK
jgi:hypothetical protein